jgi:hypothetical protein
MNQNGTRIAIHPIHNPMAPRKEGHKVHIIDHLSREQLTANCKDNFRNIENIEEIDFVW